MFVSARPSSSAFVARSKAQKQNNNRSIVRICASSESPETSNAATRSPPSPPIPAPASSSAIAPPPGNNNTLAAAGVGLGVALFVATRVLSGGPAAVTLDTLLKESIPLETALTNGKPTLIEFYADWCEICREAVPQVAEVQREVLRGKANLVMLNIDNPKWAPEVFQFGVRGIPEYVFLDGGSTPKAVLVGRLPQEVLRGDAEALVEGSPIPYAALQEVFNEPRGKDKVRGENVLDHS